jgi:arylsulfatase A-like enzyme
MISHKLSLPLGLFACIFWASASTPRPNVIVVLADDMRIGVTGYEGHSLVKTPNLDRLAAEGTVFTNGFATSAACTPSRTSLLSGLYERRHGINFNSQSSMTEEAYAKTYPMLLKQAGYFVGYVGKNHTPIGRSDEGPTGYNSGVMEESFDYWYAGHRHLRFYSKSHHPIFENAASDTQVEIIQEGVENFLEPDEAFQAGQYFLRSRPRDQPFALLINFNVPHAAGTGSMEQRDSDLDLYKSAYRDQLAAVELPTNYIAFDDIEVPKIPRHVYNGEYIRSYDYVKTADDLKERRIREMQTISGIDRLLGVLMGKLHGQGIADNTIIVFTSDHGLLHGEFGLGGKVLLYEPSIRVPLIVMDPRMAPEVRITQSDELVALVDIAPTLLDLTDIAIPQTMQGMSLKPLMQGQKTSWRQELFLENMMTIQNYPRMEGVRTQRWKYIRYFDRAKDQHYSKMINASIEGEVPIYEELFDLDNDPQETTNVASVPDNAAVIDRLRRKNAELVKRFRGEGRLDIHVER